jgi:diguanylate cyclase (GGDEF)-like protein
LDSATAVEVARREATVATTLLELSTSLAEITTVDEMAVRLVRAVPLIVGSDRAAIALRERGEAKARIVATYGYPHDLDVLVRTLTLPPPADLSGEPTFLDHGNVGASDVDIDQRAAAAMPMTGSTASLWVPIVVDGEWVGAIVAAVTGDAHRLRRSGEIDQRLRGLAGQASTAIRNARLLDQIRHQALHDPLTGLPNRTLIIDRVDQMLARSRRSGDPSAAMFVDLDGFKGVNDTFGHGAGDHLLRSVSDRLTTMLRESDTIGRLGGDEFVILLEGHSMDAGPELVAERILDVLREPFVLDGRPDTPLHVSASVGIAVGMRETAGELLRDADIALYKAKDAGKDCYVVFEPEMQTAVQDRLLLQMDLQTALEHDEFFLLYQPVSDLRSGAVTGVEALLRWRHPTRGVVQPATFIPLLEESGVIVDVGRWVLHEACTQAAARAAKGRRLHMSVNVSARQLQSDRLLADIDDALTTSGLEPGLLIVEVAETVIMRDSASTSTCLGDVKSRGVRVAIDDFGTGYSSLAYLRRFPVDTLKIDQSFVAALGGSPEAAALVHTLVQLGKTLGLETLAEGIEHPPQLARLRAEDCDAGQGYLFAEPLTSDALDAYLDEHLPLVGLLER